MPVQNRVIRVFVSSTFRDMQAERDHLVKFTFPQLRKLCESRGVTWGEVDLRWGITEEQSERGEIVSYCLEEIDRCRPYFIGLLGDYYGTLARQVAPDLKPNEGWPEDSLERSVTELEIIHGVLANPQMADHAFFYFRDPAYAQSLPEEQRRAFTNPDPSSDGKLAALKERIRQQHCDGKLKTPPRENYKNPEILGRAIRRDFTRLINTLFPENQKPDPLDSEAADHEAFAESRVRVYIGRQEYFDRLDAHVASDAPPLVVLGESGIGKSALLANWFLEHRKNYPDDFALIHFIGGTPDSTDLIRLLRRIMLELKRHFPNQIPDDVPTQPGKIREEFAQWMMRAAASERTILILDGLNQLEDRDAAPDLGWLPLAFPPNCRVILSTLPSRSLDAIRRTQWPEMTVEKLDEKERLKLLRRFLRQYHKQLSKERRRKIVAAPQTANPLFMRAMLDELRQFGDNERLGERIEHYLAAQTVDNLYGKILARYEQDYERDQQGLVGEAMSLLWTARNGLSEAELLSLLSIKGGPLPRAYWSPLYLAAESSLVIRSGLINFSHPFLRMAIRNRYLNSQDKERVVHLRLANYFYHQPLSLRKLDEQPWQDLRSEQWTNLRNTLSDLRLFEAAWDNSRRSEWISYWTAISGQYKPDSSYDVAVAKYVQQHGETVHLARIVQFIGWMLHDMSFLETSLPFKQRALAIRERHLPSDHPDIAASLGDLAEYFRVQGKYGESRPLCERALGIFERTMGSRSPLVASALNNLAVLNTNEGEYETALSFSQRAMEIWEATLPEGHPERITGLLNLAYIYQCVTDYANAHVYAKRALQSSERFLGHDHPLVAKCLEHMGTLYGSQDNEEESVKSYQRALSILEKIFGDSHPSVATCLHNLAASAQAQGRHDEARRLYQRAFRIFESAYGTDHVRLTECLSSLASNYQQQSKYGEAINLANRVLEIRERVLRADHPDIAEVHNRLGELHVVVGNYQEALHHHQKGLALREAARGSEDISVAQSLNNLAELYRKLGEYNVALSLHQRALQIRERILGNDHIAVAESLNNLGVNYHLKNEQHTAFDLCKRSLKIKEKRLGLGHPLVADTLNNLGQVLLAQGDISNALPHHKRALEIREHRFGSEHPSVAESLNNLGGVYHELSDDIKAVEHYERALRINEKVFGSEHTAVAGVLNNMAVLHYQTGQPRKAAQLFHRSLLISEKALGASHPRTVQIRQNLSICETEII